MKIFTNENFSSYCIFNRESVESMVLVGARAIRLKLKEMIVMFGYYLYMYTI